MNVQVEPAPYPTSMWVPTTGDDIEREVVPAPSTNNENGNGDPEDKPAALPLFEVRIEGIGPLAVEAVSQGALVEYIDNLMYRETASVFAPFRVEYIKKVTDGQPVVDRSIVYIDPARIIVIGPERVPLAYVEPDPNLVFDDVVQKRLRDSGPGGPAEVIILADETEDGTSSFDDASPKDEDDPE